MASEIEHRIVKVNYRSCWQRMEAVCLKDGIIERDSERNKNEIRRKEKNSLI